MKKKLDGRELLHSVTKKKDEKLLNCFGDLAGKNDFANDVANDFANDFVITFIYFSLEWLPCCKDLHVLQFCFPTVIREEMSPFVCK